MQGAHWYEIANVEEVFSPGLLVYEERVKENIARAVKMAGDPDRLRPHVKTHKMPGVMGLEIEAGITRFKCATIAEAEMAADSGAPDVMLAYPPVGPNAKRLTRLVGAFPETEFSTIADDFGQLHALSAEFHGAGKEIEVLLDVDSGMHRTGAGPGPDNIKFYREIVLLPGLSPGGLHVYDGHIKEKDPAQRLAQCDLEFAPVLDLAAALEEAKLPVRRIVAGGSPTFPIHANRKIANMECSPGTFVFWDQGYLTNFPDIGFQPAALVLTRVISMPGDGLLCLDLGHKAIASENPMEHRVRLIDLPDAEMIAHSEEHLIIRTKKANEYRVGDVLYGVPWHICPTVALYGSAVIVRHGKAAGNWIVSGRERMLGL